MLLRNVVKPEDVHDPISVGRCALLHAPLLDLNSRPLLVEEILARTPPQSQSHSSPSFLSFKTQTDFHSFRAVLPISSPRRAKYSSTGTIKRSRSSPNHPRCMLRIYHLRFPELEAAGKLLWAPRQEDKRVNAFGAPFMLDGLFGEPDAEAMDVDTDSEPAADNIGMDASTTTRGQGQRSEG
jgi:hypothetical protein